MTDSILRVSELDFDSIKTNLKDFLRTKPEFTDYDFEGSGLSVLIDLLSYNTHYEAIIANQIAQELTIDTARNSTIVGLHAKRLGYTPKSYKAARTSVNLEVISPIGSPATLTLGKGASFISSVDGSVVNFTNLSPVTISPNSAGRYIFSSVEILQGELKTFRYVYSSSLKKFELPDDTVDTSTLRVFVQTSLTNSARIEYFPVERITSINNSSLVYYLQVNQRGKYEVHFGDDVLGRSPTTNNIVVMEYIICDGSQGNDIQSFAFNDYVEGNSSVVLTTNSKSYGGNEKETIESIRFNAYKNTMIQDRAVTSDDYASIIAELFPLDSISIWGGEQNDPPKYGKVFISIKPLDSESVLTQNSKDFISKSLKTNKSIVTVSPEFVDVEYLYISPTIIVYIDDTKLNTTADYVKTLVSQAAAEYSKTNIEKFDKIFRFSKFSSALDVVDPSILSNVTSLKITKRFLPILGVKDSYKISFNNPISSGTFKSSTFRVAGVDKDLYISDFDGILQVTYIENSIQKILYSNVGTISYTDGTVTINSLVFQSYFGDYIELTGIPSSPDIISLRNTIVLLDPEKINVSVVVESKDYTEHQFAVTR